MAGPPADTGDEKYGLAGADKSRIDCRQVADKADRETLGNSQAILLDCSQDGRRVASSPAV